MFESSLQHGDIVVIVDEQSGARSSEGKVFEIDMGTVTISVNGLQMDVDGETLKGNTVFGPCTVEIVRGKNMCSGCKARNQTGNHCSNCGKTLNNSV